MYSDLPSVNTLTALLVAHGVRHVVVCPGSRNAPFVHNFTVCPDLTTHAVVDERSAGFVALGLALDAGAPVAVCATSGSAGANLWPAVVEAHYRHVPLVVITADRPASAIGQLDGQTMPQHALFGDMAAKSVTLPEADDEESRWHRNRLVNAALIVACNMSRPVHINVPLHEPLFGFNTPELPVERVIAFKRVSDDMGNDTFYKLCDFIEKAQKPLIVIGQTDNNRENELWEMSCSAKGRFLVLREPLSNGGPRAANIEEALTIIGDDTDYKPDLILHFGDNIVSKRLKQFLRSAPGATQIRFTPDPTLPIEDTFRHMDMLICDRAMGSVLGCTRPKLEFGADSRPTTDTPAAQYYLHWKRVLDSAHAHACHFEARWSQTLAVQELERALARRHAATNYAGVRVHYANSSAVRLACSFATAHYVYVNRGVNGIEGCLSAAAGNALAHATDNRQVVCVIGDLAFFYDQNALWNAELGGNLRILLLNNGGGSIFQNLPGCRQSAAFGSIAATHHTTAWGVCESYGVEYLAADTPDAYAAALPHLLDDDSPRPVLLEVRTDATQDAAEQQRYFNTLKH